MRLTALLLILTAPAGAAGFTPSRWLDLSLSSTTLAKSCSLAQERLQSRLQELASLPAPTRTFQNTPEALDTAAWDLADEASAQTFLKYVSTSAPVREAAHECEARIEKLAIETYTREDLFRALSDFDGSGVKLAGESRRLLDKQLLDFKRNGLLLAPAKRAEVKRLKDRLVDLELTFGKNLNEIKNYLPVTKEELEGLPDDYVARLEREGDKYKVTLDYPDYFPFMNNARNARARQMLEKLYNNRAAETNLVILAEVLKLRREAAKLLGYPTHAHYILEDRMAKKPAAVQKFIDKLEKRLKVLAKEELKVLKDLKRETEGPEAAAVFNAWDWRFYDNLLKKSRYQVDDEKIKEYFPMETVTAGMLAVYQKLLGVKFRAVANAELWSPDVKLYEVTDAAGGPAIGYFYMDLFPRDGKYKHAAAFTLIKGRQLTDSYQAPVSAMVANFNKPSPGRPSLLKHEEVETFFHEFGHIMHQTLTKARYGRFSGSSVARDFVEAPSQMLEEWAWQKDILNSLSGHFSDPSKKLPPELLDKMLAAKNVNSGLVNLRQLFFAGIDLRYHTAEVVDTTEEYRRLMEPISMLPMSEGTHPEASFGHLMGYDAGYYGYMWSKVFAEDMFSRFEAEGVLNPVLGRQYRELILEPGSSRDEAGQLKAFLGRAPNETAFLKSIGLNKN